MLQVVAAHGQVVRPEEDIAAAFERADAHARCVVQADVQLAVAEDLHGRRATRGSAKKEIEPPVPPPVPPAAKSVAVPALEVLLNRVTPPCAPVTVPPLLMKVPLPAVEVFAKNVAPLNVPGAVPPLLVKVLPPAVALSKKIVRPPIAPLIVAPVVGPRAGARARVIIELRRATARTGERPGVIDERGAPPVRSIREQRHTALLGSDAAAAIGKSACARGRGVAEDRKAPGRAVTVLPFVMKCPLPAVELPRKSVRPGERRWLCHRGR